MILLQRAVTAIAMLHSTAKVLAIDPGNIQTAYVLMDREYRPLRFGKVENGFLRRIIADITTEHNLQRFKAGGLLVTVIERVSGYGMPVGKEVFETCEWVGRFTELAEVVEYVYRKDVKINLCGQCRAKDPNVRQALIDRFAVHDLKNGKGTKGNPDWFYGFKSDIWAAYAVGVTYLDKIRGEA